MTWYYAMTFQPLALPASRVVSRLSKFRPRQERDRERAVCASAKARAGGGNAWDAALASVGAVALANPAFNINLFKLRVEYVIKCGAGHAAVRARYGARLEVLAKLIHSSSQEEARGSVESRHACKDAHPLSHGASSGVVPATHMPSDGAGVAPGPRAIDIAIAAVDHWYDAERNDRLARTVLAELRLILRMIRASSRSILGAKRSPVNHSAHFGAIVKFAVGSDAMQAAE